MPVDDDIFSIRDILDSQLETSDKRRIGRVSDIEAEWQDDGTLFITHLVIGPQALARRIAEPLHSFVRFFLRDHFDHSIPLSDVKHFGPTLQLRKTAAEYAIGQTDTWIADHILRWIPGSGHK
ncbi:MAG: hypothetical protein NVSMB49_14690 [Ktedonobacteraceae bacterium]